MNTIKCKYCGDVMDARTNHSAHKRYYECRKCGARGPWLDSNTSTTEQLALLTTSGSVTAVDKMTEDEKLRRRNSILSARYSRLKSCELPAENKTLRETRNYIVDLQNGREAWEKPKYLEEMARLYKNRAIHLNYKMQYEKELRDIKNTIRENKKKLGEIGRKADENKPLGREPTAEEIGSPHIKFCRNCTTACTLRGSDCFVLCGYFKEKA